MTAERKRRLSFFSHGRSGKFRFLVQCCQSFFILACAFLLDWRDDQFQVHRQQADFLRDMFGLHISNPALTTPTWDSTTVTQIAQGIYADHSCGGLPILADALEDVGCTDADILAHCRQPGEHVRGCWVVDLILGKR
jgi:hypothetical protein